MQITRQRNDKVYYATIESVVIEEGGWQEQLSISKVMDGNDERFADEDEGLSMKCDMREGS